MILKYLEALEQAQNKDWFKLIYDKDEIASDEEVERINKLVVAKGEKVLHEYFGIDDDMLLQKEYVDDLIDYLEGV